MIERLRERARPWLPLIATGAMSAIVLALAGLNYWAIREWRRGSIALADRAAYESAQLLATALVRDMRGVQMLVLANRDAGDFAPEEADFPSQLAVAFTRFPYPESFFVWRDGDSALTFFVRGSRPPSWATSLDVSESYPVIGATDAPFGMELLHELQGAAATRAAYAYLPMSVAGDQYQMVARLEYSNSFRDKLTKITGFTVNLSWARQTYFPEIVAQIARITATDTSLQYAILDEAGRPVFGSIGGTPYRSFDVPLAFFDPWSLGIAPAGTLPPIWKVRVSGAGDPGVIWAARGANWTLLVIVVTTMTLAGGFVLMGRAIQAKAALANTRAEFVAAVTHELKTPLTSICMVADGMMRRQLDTDTTRRYAGVLATESRGLSRLIDNILAYSRVTDVTEVYTFENICVAELFDDVLRGFDQRLASSSFTVDLDIPNDLPSIRGDRTALRLAFDNLVDNAIRYSGGGRLLRIAARHVERRVRIEVSDRGVGIPESEIEAVRKKFVRGTLTRHAGTGLGLAIVDRVARDHRGHLALTSTVGVGTTVVIDLPASTEE